MTTMIVIGIVLIAIAMGLFYVEVIMPTGGMMAILAAGSLIGGVIMFFNVSTKVGVFGALVALILLPTLGYMFFSAFPHSVVGQKFMLENPPMSPANLQGDAIAETPPEVQALLGARGVAVTDLRPAGICQINGQRLDCLADGPMIRAATPIRVVAADEFQIKVRAEGEEG
jgi:membrane-bound serine protease (ClpP class)